MYIKVTVIGGGGNPVRSQQDHWQWPFDCRQVVVGKRRKSSSKRRWMASLLLYREYAKAEIDQQPAQVWMTARGSAHLQISEEKKGRRTSPGARLIACHRISLWGGRPF